MNPDRALHKTIVVSGLNNFMLAKNKQRASDTPPLPSPVITDEKKLSNKKARGAATHPHPSDTTRVPLFSWREAEVEEFMSFVSEVER